MKFEIFAEHAAHIEPLESDAALTNGVADLFAEAANVDDNEIDERTSSLSIAARFVKGQVFPSWSETKLSIGPKACYSALARAAEAGTTADDIEDQVAETGDIGEVASNLSLGDQTGLDAFGAGGGGGEVTMQTVYNDLSDVAAVEGSGSNQKREDILFSLFNDCSPDEARYLSRILLGEMRIGVGNGIVRDGIVEAFNVSPDLVEHALQVSNDYGMVAVIAATEGDSGLSDVQLTVGRPIQSMLAQAGTITDAVDAWDTVAVEPKFDGSRAQVHYDGEDVQIFSRNMENVTEALPEIVEYVSETLDAPAIMDGEVVAIGDDGTPLPFQEVLKRFRREDDIARMRNEIPVQYNAFDCLYYDGESLLDVPATERHSRLESVYPVDRVSDLEVFESADAISEMEERVLEEGHEGIMLKDPGATYTPGKRGKEWLKRKPDVETLDLAVIGGEWAEGKWADILEDEKVVGSFLIAVRTDDGYETIGKIGTGLSEDELADVTHRLKPHVKSEDGKEIVFDPGVVFEVGYEEIQQSPTYSSGYALRFPRFIEVREDKDADSADSLEKVERLYNQQ